MMSRSTAHPGHAHRWSNTPRFPSLALGQGVSHANWTPGYHRRSMSRRSSMHTSSGIAPTYMHPQNSFHRSSSMREYPLDGETRNSSLATHGSFRSFTDNSTEHAEDTNSRSSVTRDDELRSLSQEQKFTPKAPPHTENRRKSYTRSLPYSSVPACSYAPLVNYDNLSNRDLSNISFSRADSGKNVNIYHPPPQVEYARRQSFLRNQFASSTLPTEDSKSHENYATGKFSTEDGGLARENSVIRGIEPNYGSMYNYGLSNTPRSRQGSLYNTSSSSFYSRMGSFSGSVPGEYDANNSIYRAPSFNYDAYGNYNATERPAKNDSFFLPSVYGKSQEVKQVSLTPLSSAPTTPVFDGSSSNGYYIIDDDNVSGTVSRQPMPPANQRAASMPEVDVRRRPSNGASPSDVSRTPVRRQKIEKPPQSCPSKLKALGHASERTPAMVECDSPHAIGRRRDGGRRLTFNGEEIM